MRQGYGSMNCMCDGTEENVLVDSWAIIPKTALAKKLYLIR